MKLKQISVPIENSHDRLYELTKALAAKGIIPRALTLVDKGNYGELRIVVSDLIGARQVLMQMNIPQYISYSTIVRRVLSLLLLMRNGIFSIVEIVLL